MVDDALELRADALSAAFLPACGMLGVSLQAAGDELVAMPRSVEDYRAGGTTGMPLLHPWANRLAVDEFDAYGVHFDATGTSRDRNGLAIHGTMQGRPFAIDATTSTSVNASCTVDRVASFPFAHQVAIAVVLTPAAIAVTTTVRNDGDQPMPVSFGWHPFFTLPARPRSEWTLRIPACRRHVLDAQMLPTGATVDQPEDRSPIGARTYDDHFTLGADRVFEIVSAERGLRVEFDEPYPHAQIYLPGASASLTGDFVCIEPMVASTNALVTETAPTIAPGEQYAATFTVSVT
jgi:aldose 1-epimerase